MVSSVEILPWLTFFTALSAVVIPPNFRPELKNLTTNKDKDGSFALTVSIGVGTQGSAETECGPTIYLQSESNGMLQIQFGSMPTPGSTYTETVYVNSPMNPKFARGKASVIVVSLTSMCEYPETSSESATTYEYVPSLL